MTELSRHLEMCVQDPFGPFEDSVVLSHKCTFVPAADRPSAVLRGFTMSCAGSIIGFDEAEFSATDPASRIQRASVSFQGVLEIETLDWLSPRGKELVEKDLRRRDIKKRLGNVPSSSNLTLEEIYRRDPTFRLEDKSQGRKIKLRIQGQKNMPALFLAADGLPDGLLIVTNNMVTKSAPRKFQVTSLEADMHNLSQNFFERYRLLAAMNAIVQNTSNDTELANRDIHYFVHNYLTECAAGHRSSVESSDKVNTWHRRIFHPAGQEKSSNPIKSRHLHRAEVLGMFAAHAEWLLMHQMALKQKKIIDLESWALFCKTIVMQRKRARQRGVQWGRAYNDNNNDGTDDEVDFARAGLPQDQVNEKRTTLKKRLGTIKTVRSKKQVQSFIRLALREASAKRKIQKAAPKLVSDSSEFEHEPDAESQTDELVDDAASDPELEAEPDIGFDSDFSVDTTPPASASSDAEEDIDPEWPEPEILAILPSEILAPPQIPGSSHQWTCPVHRCAYKINMLHISDENTQGLDADRKRFLRGKRWQLRDANVLDCMEEMIHFHYIDHLTDLDIQIVQHKGRAASFDWINPESHVSRKRERVPPPRSKMDKLVKEEDVSMAGPSSPGRRRSARQRPTFFYTR